MKPAQRQWFVASSFNDPESGSLVHRDSRLVTLITFLRALGQQMGLALLPLLIFISGKYSSPLFRMPSVDHIYNQLHFHNLGPDQTPGVIVMEIASADTEARPPPAGLVRESEGGTVDPNYKRILVVFNCSPLEQKLEYPSYTKHMVMHPEQAAFDGVDAGRVRDECAAHNSIRMITMAPRTTGVFVELK
eukprot:gene5313-18558_t